MLNFSATIEGEAARYVQYYFRKWKMRTVFQALTIYRADKQQQLVYFSQQVGHCCLILFFLLMPRFSKSEYIIILLSNDS